MIDAKNKKRKVSKKTKRAWRKHVDIGDVDAFLEDKRLEERLGPPLTELTDSELFTIDKTASKDPLSSKCASRLAWKNKEIRCLASLKPHTQVPDPISKRNRVRTKEERMSSILRQREAERKLKGILKLKERQALKDRALAKSIAENRPKRGEFTNDVWNTENDILPKAVSEWMSPDSLRHTVKHLGIKKRKLPSSLRKKPSVLPAIEVPHPGTSYNPSYVDHQNLLHEVAQKELELMKHQAHLNRVTANMFKKVSADKRDKDQMKEMSEGLPIKNQSRVDPKTIEEELDEEDSSVAAKSKTAKNVKKTLVQRRKQREEKKKFSDHALLRTEKKKISDIYKLKILQKQVETKEKKQEILRQKRMKKRERESTKPKTLSKMKFEPLDSDFQMSKELTGNLRNCDPSRNLLQDRYKSLQERNIVAPTVINLKRNKAKMKRFIKPDHKIDVVAKL